MNNKYVLLRGLVRGNGHWGNFLEVLTKHDPQAEVEVYEIPGNGTRYQEITPTTAEEVIADFRKSSEFVKNRTPFILCGISLGGMLALKWLELFPEDVVRTFIVNSSLKSLSPFYHRLSVHNYLKILKIVFSASAEVKELNVLNLTSNRKDLEPRLVAQLVEFSKNYPVNTSNFFRQLILANSIKISKGLKKPIKVVQSAQDRLVDPRCSNKIARYLEAPVITHPTAGHDIPLDDPEWLTKILMTI